MDIARRAVLLGSLATPLTQAHCSRALLVPVAHAGASVTVEGERVRGVFPEFLREVGARLGCRFEFPIVPRARVARMFLEGEAADILAPATRTSERDLKGVFVPMVRTPTMLISLRNRALHLPDVNSLLQDKGRVVVLRGYSWGDEYEALVRQLDAQGRVQYVADTGRIIERLLHGLADCSLLPPSLFLAIIQDGQRKRDWSVDDFQRSPLLGLPHAQIGLYLSRQRIPEDERQQLILALHEGVRDGRLLRLYQAHMPIEWLRDYVRIDVEALPPRPTRTP